MSATPGPWEIREDDAGLCIDTRDDEHGRRELCALNGAGDYDDDDLRANARLIASAPALLAALREIEALARGECPSIGWERVAGLMGAQARAAIRAAEGE